MPREDTDLDRRLVALRSEDSAVLDFDAEVSAILERTLNRDRAVGHNSGCLSRLNIIALDTDDAVLPASAQPRPRQPS